MDAAGRYAERVDSQSAQFARRVANRQEPDRWARHASRFTMDPHRPLDANLAIIAEYVRPDDVILDVGGGAGRVSLPLASRCREVINVEPSAGMCAAFEATARDAGITNACAIEAAWPAEGVAGDLTLVFNVTYFVRAIVPFIEGLNRAARRRVIVGVWSPPPPDQDLALFELVLGEPGERVPGHAELLPVLWEMGILPDVRVLPNPFRFPGGLPASREEAVEYTVQRLEIDGPGMERERGVIKANVDRLFRETEDGFIPTWRPEAREMLITWQTGG
jgi:SAM-dependent methyltransferase